MAQNAPAPLKASALAAQLLQAAQRQVAVRTAIEQHAQQLYSQPAVPAGGAPPQAPLPAAQR